MKSLEILSILFAVLIRAWTYWTTSLTISPALPLRPPPLRLVHSVRRPHSHQHLSSNTAWCRTRRPPRRSRLVRLLCLWPRLLRLRRVIRAPSAIWIFWIIYRRVRAWHSSTRRHSKWGSRRSPPSTPRCVRQCSRAQTTRVSARSGINSSPPFKLLRLAGRNVINISFGLKLFLRTEKTSQRSLSGWNASSVYVFLSKMKNRNNFEINFLQTHWFIHRKRINVEENA